MVSPTVKSGICMGCGSFAVVFGAIMVVFWPPIFMSQLHRMMTLTPTSMSFDIWKETPIPMYLECYMFNITNVEEILTGGNNITLRVEQVGPYVFKETHSKVNLTWHDNSTIQFYNQRYWHFEPDMSNGSLADEIVSINPVIATVAYTRRYSRTLSNLPVDLFIRSFHSNLFLTANVSAWLFDGIDDPVIDIALQLGLPFNIPYDKFGWFYDRNGSLEFDGAFLMNTGGADFSQIGNLEKWRYSDRTMYRDECGVVKGSTGELWAPELGQPDVTIFASDICTYMILGKDKDVEVEGLEGVQYAANDSVFDNGHNYPHTACYCDVVRDRDCMPSGALNVSACRFGAPAFVSLPHFLHSDPYYPSKIAGLEPTDDMDFRLALEMFTGLPLAVSAQLQINLLVRHVGGIPINNALPDPDTLVPMFWFRQQVRITPEYAAMACQALRLRYWTVYAFYGATVIGVVLLMCGVFILIRKLLKSAETTPIIEESS